MDPFNIEPYAPPRWLRGANVQSLTGVVIRTRRGIKLARERLITPDDDFIDLDFVKTDLPDEAPFALLVHGLEGSARFGYMYEGYFQLAQLGIRAVGMNLRSCSGEMNRAPRFYHPGETEDIRFVIDRILNQFPAVPIGLIGFSLGGNIVLNYAAEQGEQLSPRIKALAVVSTLFDIEQGEQVMESGWGRLYMETFLILMKRKIWLKRKILRKHVDVGRLLRAKTFQDFDEWLTIPLHGYSGLEEYRAQTNTSKFLPKIDIPTLILHARDDPMFPNMPTAVIESNPFITCKLTQNGGHVGFIEGFGRFWAERQIARFFAERLN